MQNLDEQALVLAPVWDERMWDEVWERSIGRVERHRMAMALLRREQPEDRLARRVVPELARRWRRSCVIYALGWGLFTTFWLAVGIVTEASPDGGAVVTPWWMGMLGGTIVAVALTLRWWIRDMAGPAPVRRR